MKVEKSLLLLIVLLIFSFGFGQHKLSLDIKGVSSDNGNVCVAIYQDQNSFLKFDKVFKIGSEKAVKGSTHIEIDDIPVGEYAVAIFHDENGNKKLDTNFMGIPKEAIAFSRGKMKMFGPPRFDECAFEIVSNTNIRIDLQ
jgi:uncharacterized protein (DUF2141 family)